jgi:hypothetical protein
MMVARHSVPGKAYPESVPLGHGVSVTLQPRTSLIETETFVSTAVDHAVHYGTDAWFRSAKHFMPSYHHSGGGPPTQGRA